MAGWGVDALVGRQARVHRDLDLAVRAEDETVAIRTLQQRGYTIDTDQRPVRVELAYYITSMGVACTASGCAGPARSRG